METQRKVCTRRIIKHSQSVQDLVNVGFKTDRRNFNTCGQIRTGERTPAPAYLHRLAVDSLITRQGSLILLNGPNAVQVCKPINRAHQPDVYLPAITGKMSNLQTRGANLSQSCSYMYTNGRRGSTLSVISQRASNYSSKPVKNKHVNCLKEQKDLRKSNVLVTMTYLNQGKQETTKNEMKVLQQSCGGENICVFKGYVQSGEQFQFTSQRHLGYPFSVTFYVDGIIAGRISSCCEYRYTPGFQQGRKSCFRLTRLCGGKPCYKCVNSRHSIDNEANEVIHHNQQTLQSHEGTMESRSSSPLFIPVGMKNQRTRNLCKDSNTVSTDSEDKNDRTKPKKKRQKRHKSRHQQSHGKSSEESKIKADTGENESKPPAMNQFKTPLENRRHAKVHSNTDNKDKLTESSQDREALSQQTGKKVAELHESNGESRNQERPRDFFEECVEISTGLELSQDQQKWFKASMYERNKIREQLKLDSHYNKSASDLELSEESDTCVIHLKNEKPRTGSISQEVPEKDTSKEEELQKMLDAMIEMLSTTDEVEQLVLRNTGVTDELLKGLVMALKNSQSEVTMINLNLNHIGPAAVQDLLDLLQAKPEIKGLLLFGNHLGDVGVQMLLCGVADLQDKTAAPPRIPAHPRQFYLSELSNFTLVELDLGGNGIGSEGLKVLGTFMRYHSHLQYLGLAQTSCSDTEAWNVLFESLKVNNKLTQIILDENNLGDQGVKLFAEALRVNEGLQKIDLDCNNFGDVGGNAVLEALLFQSQGSLEHLSLEENYISTAVMSKIQQLVNTNSNN